MHEHPLRKQRPATRDDADETLLDERQMFLQHARVNREVINALRGLMFKHREDDFFVEVFEFLPDDHRVNRHGTDGNSRVEAERFTALIEVATGRKIHDRVRAPLLRPLQFLDLFMRTRGNRRRAHVCIDLRLRRATDGHRIQLVCEVHAIGWNHHATCSDLITHLQWSEMWLTRSDAFHFFRHNTKTRALKLRDRDEVLWRTHAHPYTTRGHEINNHTITRVRFRCRLLRKGGARPIVRKKIPRGLLTRAGHPWRIGRTECIRTTDICATRERSRRCALRGRRRIARAMQW